MRCSCINKSRMFWKLPYSLSNNRTIALCINQTLSRDLEKERKGELVEIESRVEVKVKLQFLAPSVRIAEIRQT